MERLTTRNSMGVAVYRWPYTCENCNESFWRLPDYGDGSPTEKLAQYEEKEEKKQLVILPCNVGDTVYQVMLTGVKASKPVFEIYEAKVIRFVLDSFYLMIETKIEGEKQGRLMTAKCFGETIFVTKEEAEIGKEKMELDIEKCNN